jgi:hypothetical protein
VLFRSFDSPYLVRGPLQQALRNQRHKLSLIFALAVSDATQPTRSKPEQHLNIITGPHGRLFAVDGYYWAGLLYLYGVHAAFFLSDRTSLKMQYKSDSNSSPVLLGN